MPCFAVGGCQFGVSSRQRRAGQGQKESSQTPHQPLAPRSICAMLFPRGLCYISRIPLAKRNGPLLRPSPTCLPRPRRRQAEPPSCSLFVWRRAATAEGWARPSLMVGHVGARCQRAQDSTIQIHKPPSQHWPTDFLGSFGQCWLGRSLYRQLQRRAGRK